MNGRSVHRGCLREAPPNEVGGDAGLHLLARGQRYGSAGGIRDPPRLHLKRGEEGADLVEHSYEAEAGQIGMERELVEIGVNSVHIKCVPDSVAEKWQIRIVAGAEDNGVHFLNAPVCEPDRLPVHLHHPRLRFDTAFGYQRQEMLTLRDACIEDGIGRFKRAELLWATAGLNDEVFERAIYDLARQILFRKRRKTRESELIQGYTREQLVKDIALGGDSSRSHEQHQAWQDRLRFREH